MTDALSIAAGVTDVPQTAEGVEKGVVVPGELEESQNETCD